MIEIKNLNKFFNKGRKNEIHVINNVSLNLEDNGLVALLGPSGSGKTTLLNVIGGLDKAKKGQIYVNGKKITSKFTRKVDKIRNLEIGYIFQDYKLIEDMTVYANIAIVLKMIGIKDKKEIKTRVNYILEKVDMYRYRNRPVNMLSGGERQRVGIARAIAKAPNIIIADEPTGNLDSKNSLEIMNIIKAISKEKLVILVTHERNLAEFYASRIIEIEDGTVKKDYKNEHEEELDYRIENQIYLKDLKNKEELQKDNININIYSDTTDKVDLSIVVKNGNIYIKSMFAEKIEAVDQNSKIEFIDSHYKKVSKTSVEKYKFDFEDIINNKIKERYSSIFNPITLLTNGFRKVFSFSILKKLLLIGFFLSGVFIMYATSNICATLTIEEKDFVKYNKNYLTVLQKNVNVEDYLKYEQNEKIIYMLPGSSIVELTLKFKEFYQTSQALETLEGSLASTSMLSNENLIYGKLPQTPYEIVLDKMLLEKAMKDKDYLKMAGIITLEDFINKELNIENVPEFLIVGISDTNSPSIYVSEQNFINIIYNTNALKEEGYYRITDKEGTSGRQEIIDYNLLTSKIALKKGRTPENDYEVIVNESHKYEMPLNKTIDTKVNETKLKVVGYYTSMENIDKYLVNNNTIKYQLITDTEDITIYTKNKEQVLQEFRDSKINIKDSYENSKSEYLKEQKESMKTEIIVSGVILVISLIEIFLMMRSSFLSRIKEVGILRAIGVKKRDIYKMFKGEIIAITTLASLPGILIMAYALNTLSGIRYLAPYIMVNIWIVLFTVIIIYAFNLLVGLMPLYNVIRKTPSQILSRHDI